MNLMAQLFFFFKLVNRSENWCCIYVELIPAFLSASVFFFVSMLTQYTLVLHVCKCYAEFSPLASHVSSEVCFCTSLNIIVP